MHCIPKCDAEPLAATGRPYEGKWHLCTLHIGTGPMKVLAVLFREFDHDCFEFRIGCLFGEIEDAVASPLNSAPRISEIVHGIRGFLAVTIFHDFF
jgi:hypothetical protein